MPNAPVNNTPGYYRSICGNEKSTLTVTGSGGTIRWFNVPNGGTPIATGSSYTTPVIANATTPGAALTVTYYAEEVTSCDTSPRVAIPITVKYKYAVTSTTPHENMVVCDGTASTVLSIATNAPNIEWGIFFGDGTVLSTSNTYTAPVQPGIMYYATVSGDTATTCVTNTVFYIRTATATSTAPANVTPVDSITNICPGRSVVLRIESNNGGVLLYNTPTGGSAIASSSSSVLNVQYLETPVITGTTTFYAQSGIGACASPRIPVTVTTTPSPTGVITLANDTIKASNLFNTYVLKKDGAVVSSGSTGSFAVPATTCGTYQAEFTNTINNCTNVGVYMTRQVAPCGTYLQLSNIQFPVTYNYAFGTPAGAPSIVQNQNPITIPSCTNVQLNMTVRSANGCMYNFSFQTASLTNGPVNTGMTSTTDTLTSCTIFSNTIQIAQQGPTNTTASPWLTICSGSSTNLSASGAGTLEWYANPSGGTALGTGSTFTTPALTQTTTYYVQSVNGGCASIRTAITVNVNPLPTVPVNITPAANQNICSGNSTVLSVTPPANGIATFWSMFPQGGNTFSTANSVTIPASSLTATDTFYVGHVYINNNCNSPLIPVIVAVTPTPAAPVNTSGNSQTVCAGSTTTLSVTGGGNLRWYAASAGGAALATGNSYTTPALTVATSYCVSDSSNGGSSTRTEIPVTLTPVPQAPVSTTATANLTRCQGNSTTLSATTSFAGAQLKWYDVAIGGTVLSTGGSYNTITLQATDTFYVAAETATCASQRTPIIVTVNSTPVASINPTTVTICSGDNAALTASGGGTYAWSNSGGNSAQANFSPAATTTYTVTVTSAGCSATATRNVTVNSLPTAVISPATVSICSGESAQLTASGGSYAWSNNLGSNATVTVSPGITTSYTVTVTNANNCTTTATRSVTVNNVTAAVNGPTTICAGLQATLTASGGNTYAWSNNLGSNATIAVSPTANTTYTVTVTGAGNCTATASQTVSVQSAPTAVINGNTTICNGESTTLTANGGNTYAWANGLGSNAAVTVSPAATTTYTVTVTIGANCTATATQAVTVNQPSNSSISQTVCFGETFGFAGNVLVTAGIYYDTLQNMAGCDSIVALNFNVLPLAQHIINAAICTNQSYDFDGQSLVQAGQYFDTLQTQAGCDSFIVLNLTVTNQLSSSISAAICQGESYDFNGEPLTIAATYTNTLISAGGCDSVVTLTLTVNALPQPIVTASGNTLSTQSFDSYQWLLSGSNIQGAAAQNYTATQNGSYTVWVSDANGCTATSAAFNLTGVSITDLSLAGIKIYPNPAVDIVVIELPLNDVTKLTITDISGHALVERYITGKQVLDISLLPAGILNIQLSNNAGLTTAKLVKLK